MLRTINLTTDLESIPIAWVFEYYLKLSEKLEGQNLMILSPFNANDKRPSLSLFLTEQGVYRFRDFSRGLSGDHLELVKLLFNLSSRGEASKLIVKNYNDWTINNPLLGNLGKFKARSRYKVTSVVERQWNTLDKRFWTQFHIGTRLLNKYNVRPLQSYVMQRDDETLCIEGRSLIYGYFRESGDLYKIYQPYSDRSKYLKVRDYIQGSDQLTYTKKYLIITSSLKDIMAIDKLDYGTVELIAPDSENTIINPGIINSFKLKYESICTLFDNDLAGEQATQTYKEKFNIPGAICPLEKDPSDCMQKYGIYDTKKVLTPVLRSLLTQ